MSPIVTRPERPTLDFEQACWARGSLCVAGVDEVGRGAWAGPVVAAAVILPAQASVLDRLTEVRDSKALTPQTRERLAKIIREVAIAVGVGRAEADVVDTVGLLPATARAMRAALEQLTRDPDEILVDGLPMKALDLSHTAIVKGDARSVSIAAASIVAKVARDGLMRDLDPHYPVYLFARNKGYGSQAHAAALRMHGPCPLHRRSYAPVAAAGSVG